MMTLAQVSARMRPFELAEFVDGPGRPRPAEAAPVDFLFCMDEGTFYARGFVLHAFGGVD